MADQPQKIEDVELSVEQLDEAAGGLAGDGSVTVQTGGDTALIGLLLPAVQKVRG